MSNFPDIKVFEIAEGRIVHGTILHDPYFLEFAREYCKTAEMGREIMYLLRGCELNYEPMLRVYESAKAEPRVSVAQVHGINPITISMGLPTTEGRMHAFKSSPNFFEARMDKFRDSACVALAVSDNSEKTKDDLLRFIAHTGLMPRSSREDNALKYILGSIPCIITATGLSVVECGDTESASVVSHNYAVGMAIAAIKYNFRKVTAR